MFHGLHKPFGSSLDLQRYCDTYWARDPTDRRSTTGYCFFPGSSLISWQSKKQIVISHSSIEPEYRALADVTSEVVLLRWLLQDISVSHHSSTPIHCDIQSAIQIAHNDVFMRVLSVSRLIVTLFIIICFNRHFGLLLLPIKLRKLISSPSHFPLVNFFTKWYSFTSFVFRSLV